MLRLSLDVRFRAVSLMNLESGLLSLENFKAALSSMQRQPKLEAIRGTNKPTSEEYVLLHCSVAYTFSLGISIGINFFEQIVPYWSFIFWYV